MYTEQTYLQFYSLLYAFFKKDISELHSVKDDSTYLCNKI